MSEKRDMFNSRVVPIMDKVREDIQARRTAEYARHTLSMPSIMAGSVGPDGGMAANAAYADSLKHIGEWSSKTVEDYISMVKAELKRQHITVTPELEKRMIDKMVKDSIPKSSIDYVLKKASDNSLFGLSDQLRKSPLQQQIDRRAEQSYNPSKAEKTAAWGLGAGMDMVATGGMGSWKGAVGFLGADFLFSNLGEYNKANAEENKYKDVPIIVAPDQRDAYLKDKEERERREKEKMTDKMQEQTQEPQQPTMEVASVTTAEAEQQTQDSQNSQTNISGWDGLLQSFGLNGFSDIGKNLGYVLATLPDILVGLFTGKTKSLNVENSVLPLASIVAGLFVKNPILKMMLIGMGGANLVNKAGHEALERKQNEGRQQNATVKYRTYADEPLNSRIKSPMLQGNCLIADIDNVPCTVQLPDNVVGAYKAGALPLNTLANAILARNDQMRSMAAQRYEEDNREAISRTRGIK